METIDFDVQADVVAVTATTVQAPTAYLDPPEVRAARRDHDSGGIHASVMQQEASAYADSVAIGEADEKWTWILADFERGE